MNNPIVPTIFLFQSSLGFIVSYSFVGMVYSGSRKEEHGQLGLSFLGLGSNLFHVGNGLVQDGLLLYERQGRK